jgi:hypothetical protein
MTAHRGTGLRIPRAKTRIRSLRSPSGSSAAAPPKAAHATLAELRYGGSVDVCGPFVYYMITMLLRSQSPLCEHAATLFSVAQPLLAVFQKPLCQPAATMHPDAILCDPHFGVAQVIDQVEPKSEPEQFIEKAWLTEAKKTNLNNLLKTKDRVCAGFLLKSEPEHSIENKQHY